MTREEKFRQLTCTQKIRADLRGSSIRAAAFTGAAGAIDFIIRIGSTAVLARLLLPEHFGLVMMVTAVTAVADQFRDLGLSSATVQRKEISHKEVSNLFWLNCAAGTVITLIVCGLAPLISNYYKDSRLTPITCILATNFFWGGLMVQHQAMLTRQLKLGHTSCIRLSSSFLSTILAIVLAWRGFGYWALVWREVARSLLLTFGMWLCFPWMPGLPSRKTDVWGLVHFGTHLAGANILASFSSGVDRFLIGRYWHAEQVAMYRQAYQLAVAPIEQLLGPVYLVSQPTLSMLQSEDRRYCRFFQRALTAICVASMPLSLFVAAFPHEITRVILGRKWHDAEPILMILSFGSFIKQAVGSAGWILITRGRSKTYLALTILQNATVIVFMVIGVQWGTKGVAIADVAAAYVLVWPKLHYSLKNSPVTLRAFCAAASQPALASIIMYGVLMWMQMALPETTAPIRLMLGSLVAMVAFFGAWVLLPGGWAELTGLIHDFVHAIQRKTNRPKPAGTDNQDKPRENGLDQPVAVGWTETQVADPSRPDFDEAAKSNVKIP